MTASRRQKILAESARLFSERGMSATTIREIADAVGLNSGTLYHYFSSKDAIVSEILRSFLTDLVCNYESVRAEPETARHRLGLMVRVSLEVADQHPYATEIYQNEIENLGALPEYTEIAGSVESSHRAWFDVVDEGVRNGEFNSGIDVFEFQRMMRECVFQSVRWHRDTLAADIESITATVTSVFFDGFAPARTESTTVTPPPSPTKVKREPAPAEPPIDTVDDLRSELDELRSDMRAMRGLMESLSKSRNANGNTATDD
ncbi:TetR family transcriptional regulator [Rhodococcus sp. SMB37]|uniref:TetR/AcrR family transcriptional regulator n=1 Tax=Rhodococcus sp. SMB37 TaxID=2512213 RepID=UPI0010E79730|nr:TetR/AcrR family transcriptional regulator [Rhodococcus sp. SMB37]TCN47336.1 TetR family transcriptional regulator [Rhodococcus sp. SMB37]